MILYDTDAIFPFLIPWPQASCAPSVPCQFRCSSMLSKSSWWPPHPCVQFQNTQPTACTYHACQAFRAHGHSPGNQIVSTNSSTTLQYVILLLWESSIRQRSTSSSLVQVPPQSKSQVADDPDVRDPLASPLTCWVWCTWSWVCILCSILQWGSLNSTKSITSTSFSILTINTDYQICPWIKNYPSPLSGSKLDS